MRCHELREKMVALCYGEQDLDAEASAHLSSCQACQEFAAQNRALDRVLAEDTDEPASLGFDTRFFARLNEQKQRRRLPQWRWWQLGAVSFVTAMVAVVVAVSFRTPGGFAGPDIELAMNLDLVENFEVISHLDEVEALDVLTQLKSADLSAVRIMEGDKP